MKRGGIVLLAVSLAANVALLLGLPAPDSTDAGAGLGSHDTVAGPVAAGPAEEAPGAATAVEAGVIAGWDAIESTDLAVVRDRLRAAGFPEEYVRAILWQRIQKVHAGERLALVQGREIRPFWKPFDRAGNEALAAAERELDRGMREEFNAYFDEPMGDVARARQARARLAFLPGEKAEVVTRIDSDYSELRRQIQGDMFSGIQLDEDQQKLAMLEKERRADLAKVLSPEELELYDLHTSQTANSMRSRLALFEPDEEEFRVLHALQRTFDDEFGTMYGQPSRDMMNRRAEAQRQLDQQIAGVLGAERYADYQRATNFGYQAAVKIVDHFKRPRENAAAVYALEQEYRRIGMEARRSGGDRQQLAELAQSMAAEAASRVTELLGEEGARAFRESGGSWLRSLEQQAQRAAASPPP